MTIGERAALAGLPTALYRFYDNKGQLLYVGITHNIDERWATHERIQPWWLDVAHREFVWCETRAEAEEAEAKAATEEKPRYDRSGKRMVGGEVDQRRDIETQRAVDAVTADIDNGTYPLWHFLPSYPVLSQKYGIPIIGISRGLTSIAYHEHTLVYHQDQFAVSRPDRVPSEDAQRIGLLYFLASNAFGDSSFTLTDLAETTGASRGTAYQHVRRWQEADRVECLGPVPGRRSMVYKIARHPEPDQPKTLTYWSNSDILGLARWLTQQLDSDEKTMGVDVNRDRAIIEACQPDGGSGSQCAARVLKVMARRYQNRAGCLPEWGVAEEAASLR